MFSKNSDSKNNRRNFQKKKKNVRQTEFPYNLIIPIIENLIYLLLQNDRYNKKGQHSSKKNWNIEKEKTVENVC